MKSYGRNRTRNRRKNPRVRNTLHLFIDDRQTLKSESSIEVFRPKILTNEIKYKCLSAFNDTMSNAMVEQVTCVICACRYFKKECSVMNIGCIPNEHVLYPTDELPSCVIRLNRDIDPQIKYVQITGK